MVAFADGVQYFNTTAFGASDLARFVKLHDLVQVVQQRSTPPPGSGKQQQVCHCNSIMIIMVMSA